MSKQLSIDTAIIKQEKEKQKNCKHKKMITIPAFDFFNDEVYYFGYCPRCNYKEE